MFKETGQYERTSEKKISTKQMIFLLVTTVLSTADVFCLLCGISRKTRLLVSVVISFVTSSIVFVFIINWQWSLKKKCYFPM